MTLSRGKVVGPGGRVGQFWTPPAVARQFARWAGIRPGLRVVDVGAGMGALSYAALELGARVVSVEVDEALVERIRAQLERRGATVVHRDVLAPLDRRQVTIGCGYSHDLAISNPPWEQDLPELFVERALAQLAPRVAAIVPVNMLAGVRRSRFWRSVQILRLKVLPRRPHFAGRKAGMRDVMFVEVVARRVCGEADHVALEVGE
jgi:SAM-dependent methyltransferase